MMNNLFFNVESTSKDGEQNVQLQVSYLFFSFKYKKIQLILL